MGLIKNRVRVGSAGRIDINGLRSLAMQDSAHFVNRCRDLIDNDKWGWEHITRLDHLWYALRDVPVEVHMEEKMGTRAVMSNAFTALVGDLTVASVNKAYDAVPTIGEMLTTQMNDSNKTTWVTAVHTLDADQTSVKEGDVYPPIEAYEEPSAIGSHRNGRRLTITAEAIEENQIGDILRRVNALGEIAAEHIEERTLSKVVDENDDVYRPAGTAEALYSATARARTGSSGNLKVSNGLSDVTDLENVRALLAAMKNSRGKRIYLPMDRMTILVPDALHATVWQIRNQVHVPGEGYDDRSEWGSQGLYRPGVLSSPKLDDISTTTWFMGDFQAQFVRKWKLNLEYATMGSNSADWVRSRLAAELRLGWDCEIGCSDYVYVVKSISTTA